MSQRPQDDSLMKWRRLVAFGLLAERGELLAETWLTHGHGRLGLEQGGMANDRLSSVHEEEGLQGGSGSLSLAWLLVGLLIGAWVRADVETVTKSS